MNELGRRGLLRGVQDHSMSLPICSRTGDVLEPLLKAQWFVRCRDMADRALQALEDGDLQLVPQTHESKLRSWLSEISDWCLSRQIWWGHRIPAYQLIPLQHSPCNKVGDLWVCARNEQEARKKACEKFGLKDEDFTLQQDEDVLDTWFSSALFPFAALGWPRQTKDLEAFYPNTMIETGHDLIFFWVARMAMLGQQLTGKLPFHTVLFHPMVRGAHGKKMSKSLGNAIDPLDVISGISCQDMQSKLLEGNLTESELCISHELQKKQFPNGIPECGTDALRFAFCSLHLKGEDVIFDVATVLNFRHFCNKIWNALKFTLAALGNDFEPQPLQSVRCLTDMQKKTNVTPRVTSIVPKCEHE
uniref:valine--tRNA ligase n=1 Tax=Eptatretus burgeri TaxID=7764 RepID=A0A8C4WX18_EPTBU